MSSEGESINVMMMEAEPIKTERVPETSSSLQEALESPHIETDGSSEARKSISERLSTLTKDGSIEEADLSEFVSLLSENVVDTKDQFALMEPLLTCDTETMKTLVTKHHLLFLFENWIQRSQASSIAILRLLLKSTEKIIRRIAEVPYYIDSKLIEQLKALKTHSDEDIASQASQMVTALKFSLADNSDPLLDHIREAIHESHKRPIDQADSEIETDVAPNAKRQLTSDSALNGDEMFSYSATSDLIRQDEEEEQISAKTGKPKKRVRWVSEDDLNQENVFFKNMPVRFDGTLAEFEAQERRPKGPQWKILSIDYGTALPIFIRTQRALESLPSRSYTEEVERQKTAVIALYLSDTDIPPNPLEPPTSQEIPEQNQAGKQVPVITIPLSKEIARRSSVNVPGPLQRVQLHPHATSSTENGLASPMNGVGSAGTPTQQNSLFPASNAPQAHVTPMNQAHRLQPPPQPHLPAPGYAPNGFAPQSYPPPAGPLPMPTSPPYSYAPHAAQGSQYAPRPVSAPGYAPHPFQAQHAPITHGYAQHPLISPPPAPQTQPYQPTAQPPSNSPEKSRKVKLDPSSIVHASELVPTEFPMSRLKSPEDRTRFVCRQWRKKKTCAYGSGCNFMHPKDLSRF